MANRNLTAAKNAKNDEFYTQSSDIEEELRHYTKHFKDKVVYCNCDDPTESNFWRYFYRSFGYLGLKKLISTHYEQNGTSSYALIYQGGYDNAENFDEGVNKIPLKSNGDFCSDECINYLKESDIIVTNPPFSLARKYIKQLMSYHKEFLIIGNKNWITYKEVFPLLMNHQMWIGANNVKQFKQPDGTIKKFGNIGWFTNLSLQKSTDQMVIWKDFDQKDYPAYDNYPAFECGKVIDIPKDTEITTKINKDDLKGWQDTYQSDLTIVSADGNKVAVKIKRPIWGVPITFMDKYNPSSSVQMHNLGKEFDILGITKGRGWDDFNKVKVLKNFENNQQYNKKGVPMKSNNINTGPALHVDTIPNSSYYTVSKINGYFVVKYARILIRAKKGAQF